MTPTAQDPVLDVRVMPPYQRHPLIMHTFDGLPPGGGFQIVNDHDPLPLRHHLEDTRPGEFGWTYLEQGPALWRVAITRQGPDAAGPGAAEAARSGCCGGCACR